MTAKPYTEHQIRRARLAQLRQHPPSVRAAVRKAGTIKEAAATLGISTRSLYTLLKQIGDATA